MRIDNPVSDRVFRCLADERRRHILGYFRNSDADTASFDDLVDHVIEREGRSPVPDRENVAIDLYHYQLPMLADHDVIDVDGRTERIRYIGDETLEAVLGRVPRRSTSTVEAEND